MPRGACISLLSLALVLAADAVPLAAQATPARESRAAPATQEFRTNSFILALRKDSQTLARLSPAGEPAFDFVPSWRAGERQDNGFVHLGDIHLRLRSGAGPWRSFSSAKVRKPLRALKTEGDVLAAADISASLGAGLPLSVERRWIKEGDALVMRFTLANTSTQPVEIGVLGLPMVFDNIITDRSLDEAHAQASFVDPYIGMDAGYLQVTRLSGKGPALLALPDGKTPLEAYQPIAQATPQKASPFSDKTQRGQTFEGFYDWTVASKAYVDQEWRGGGEPWNAPTSISLAPGEKREFGIRFVTSPSIREIEPTLATHNRPVAIGLPGYVVQPGAEASLFLKNPSPVKTISVYPAGALDFVNEGGAKDWNRYKVVAKGWGRARATIAYEDGTSQVVSYFITKPAERTVADLGHFSTTRQYFDDSKDPFGRAPSILTYDREADRIVTQDTRVWIAGMSDEGGGGAWVAAAMKQLDNPVPEEVAKLERVVNETVVGKLQVADGPNKGGVRKSLFYYDPAGVPGYYDPKLDWSSWTSWKKDAAQSLVRSYNYPHVAAGHWVLYRLARNHQGLVKAHDWRWYLDYAYHTTVAMMRDAPHYAQFGQMEGEIFLEILKDLKREGMTEQANEVERLMKERADHWRTLSYPFGSEMAWDSTGQPEVYAWMRYFGFDKEAEVTREVILGYDPTVPHWGYNGNARRYWDFLYGGKVKRIERQIHHYGSALNAVPLLDAYRRDPDDLHLLRVGYGGLLGGITNIDPEGFSSAAFHAYPDQMRFDPLTGDYGMGFFGHAYATASYLVSNPQFGWLGFGGNVSQDGSAVLIRPTDSARTRLFIAPAGLWVTLDAGKIQTARYDSKSGEVTLSLDPGSAITPTARLAFETTAAGKPRYRVRGLREERGAYSVPLGSAATSVKLTPSR